MSGYKLPENKVLILKTVNKDMKAYGEFQYPKSGHVVANDFNDRKRCGNGLHGFLWGVGYCPVVNWSNEANWLVLEVCKDSIVKLERKVKFKEGNVVFVGNQYDATQFINKYSPNNSAILGITLTGGYRSTLTGGYRSTLTGGYRSTLTGGDESTLTAGDESTLTGGDWSTLTAGDRSTLTGGNESTLTGGDWSTLTGGNESTLTGGYRSTLTIKYYDADRYRLVVAYVGEDGIKPDTPYTFDKKTKSWNEVIND